MVGGWRLAVGVFGSGDCPNRPSIWRYVELDAELRAWNYQKSQSPWFGMENEAQFRSSARFEVRFPRRQKLCIFGVLIDQSPSSPVRGLGSAGRMTTMATAVCASAKHAISYQFSGCAKPKGLL